MDNWSSQISVDNLMNTAKIISGYERLSGSQEELASFKYLEEELKKLGVETQLILHDAYISIPVFSKLIFEGEEIYGRAPSMGKTTDEKGITGEIIYIDNIENLSIEKCSGKIVMMDGRATYKAAKTAVNAGAKALICVQYNRINECIISNAWGSPTPDSKDLIPDIAVISIDDKSAEKIKNNTSKKEVCIITKVDTSWRKIPILIGEVKAPIKTDKYVMFTGHLDSWYYGAIDNGTVNSTQLEITRIVAENKNKLKRNYKVVYFSGHSHGRYAGSAWFADNYWKDLHYNCIINVNGDSIEGKNASDITHSMIMPEAKDLAIEIIKEQTGEDFVGLRCERKADQSFWINGITSAFASFSRQLTKEKTGNDLGWWWHTPEDTFDKVDPDNLLRDAGIFASFIMNFLTSSVIPLNFCKTAIETKEMIEYWNDTANGRFDFGTLLNKSEKLYEYCQAMYNRDIKDEASFNDTIMKLGRILVPLNFTTGNIYENDSCNENLPMPSLKLIKELVKTTPESTQEYEIKVELTHKRNYVNHSLTEAIKLIQEYNRDLIGEEAVK